jgi:hypothetical protein
MRRLGGVGGYSVRLFGKREIAVARLMGFLHGRIAVQRSSDAKLRSVQRLASRFELSAARANIVFDIGKIGIGRGHPVAEPGIDNRALRLEIII